MSDIEKSIPTTSTTSTSTTSTLPGFIITLLLASVLSALMVIGVTELLVGSGEGAGVEESGVEEVAPVEDGAKEVEEGDVTPAPTPEPAGAPSAAPVPGVVETAPVGQ